MKKIEDCLTSELLFQAIRGDIKSKDKLLYVREYGQRLRKMGLSSQQIIDFCNLDTEAIKNGCYMDEYTLLASKPFITPGMTEDSIKLDNCTFSELVYLTDEANLAYIQDYYLLPRETWELVTKHCIREGSKAASKEMIRRLKSIDVTKAQKEIFIETDERIIHKVKYSKQ